MVESPPADAGDMGSCPGPERSHMPQSSWAREPWPLSLHVWSLCSATGEATTVRGPRTPTKKKCLVGNIDFGCFKRSRNIYQLVFETRAACRCDRVIQHREGKCKKYAMNQLLWGQGPFPYDRS